MVFRFKDCSDLLLETKYVCSSDREKLMRSKTIYLISEPIIMVLWAYFLGSAQICFSGLLEVDGQNNFWNRILFWLDIGGLFYNGTIEIPVGTNY